MRIALGQMNPNCQQSETLVLPKPGSINGALQPRVQDHIPGDDDMNLGFRV